MISKPVPVLAMNLLPLTVLTPPPQPEQVRPLPLSRKVLFSIEILLLNSPVNCSAASQPANTLPVIELWSVLSSRTTTPEFGPTTRSPLSDRSHPSLLGMVVLVSRLSVMVRPVLLQSRVTPWTRLFDMATKTSSGKKTVPPVEWA